MAALEEPTGTELEPLDKARHTPKEILTGLTAMAINGGDSELAAGQLHELVGISLHPRTLRHWRARYPNRYAKACEEHAPAIEAKVLHLHREIATQAAQGVLKAIRVENRRLDYGQVDNAARSAKDLSTAAAIAVDKVHAITGRPTNIVEHRNADQILRELQAFRLIEDNITDADVIDEEPQATPQSRALP